MAMNSLKMKAKLSECPFCAQSMAEVETDAKKFYVICGECGARGPWAHDEQTIVQMWNERRPPPGRRKR
jgi:Lar family restriction alleviation protein